MLFFYKIFPPQQPDAEVCDPQEGNDPGLGVHVTRAQFEEDNNVVEFEVHRDMQEEFLSDGEITDSADDSNSEPEAEMQSQTGESLDNLRIHFGPWLNINSREGICKCQHHCLSRKKLDELTDQVDQASKNNNFVHVGNSTDECACTEQSEDESEVVLSQTTRDHIQINRLKQELSENNQKMEQKLDKLTNALVKVQDLVKRTGKKVLVSRRTGKGKPNEPVVNKESETTIYHNAVPPIEPDIMHHALPVVTGTEELTDKHFSSSSDEM